MNWINFLTWRCRCPFRSDPAPILAASCKNANKSVLQWKRKPTFKERCWKVSIGIRLKETAAAQRRRVIVLTWLPPPWQHLDPNCCLRLPLLPPIDKLSLSLSSGYVIAWNRIFVFRWFENPGARFQKCKIHDDQISLFLHYLYFVKSDQIK